MELLRSLLSNLRINPIRIDLFIPNLTTILRSLLTLKRHKRNFASYQRIMIHANPFTTRQQKWGLMGGPRLGVRSRTQNQILMLICGRKIVWYGWFGLIPRKKMPNPNFFKLGIYFCVSHSLKGVKGRLWKSIIIACHHYEQTRFQRLRDKWCFSHFSLSFVVVIIIQS